MANVIYGPDGKTLAQPIQITNANLRAVVNELMVRGELGKAVDLLAATLASVSTIVVESQLKLKRLEETGAVKEQGN